MGLGLASWCGAKHYHAIKEKRSNFKRSFCTAAIRGQDEIWYGIIRANIKTDGLATDAEHVRYAIILGRWSKSFCVCLSWSRCTWAVQHRFTDQVHFLKDNGMIVNNEPSCRLQQDGLAFSIKRLLPNLWAYPPSSSFQSEPLSALSSCRHYPCYIKLWADGWSARYLIKSFEISPFRFSSAGE